MSNAHHSQTAGASLGRTEALLAGVLAAAKAALPQGLDLLVWGASRLGDQATLRYLLANGGGTSWRPSEGDDELEGGPNSCLRAASVRGHTGAVKELLESGVDVDEAQTNDGRTALFIAAQEGHEGVVEQLLKAGADVNKATTDNGTPPLCIAAGKGHEGVVEQLLKADADVNKATADVGGTPLYIAAQEGHEGVVEQLLKADANVNKATTDDGTSPLFTAVLNGHGGVVEQLVKAGADVNKVTTDDGTPPLFMAAIFGHEGMVIQLMKAGADPNAERTSGAHRTSLGASSNGYTRICSLLLEAGANVNGASEEVPPLATAVTRYHREVALVLMEHGAPSSDESLTPAMLKDLTKWMAEALKENKRAMEEKDRQIEQMVEGIPEWCAQAASCVAAEMQNDGSCDAASPLQPSCAGGKPKAPSTGE